MYREAWGEREQVIAKGLKWGIAEDWRRTARAQVGSFKLALRNQTQQTLQLCLYSFVLGSGSAHICVSFCAFLDSDSESCIGTDVLARSCAIPLCLLDVDHTAWCAS